MYYKNSSGIFRTTLPDRAGTRNPNPKNGFNVSWNTDFSIFWPFSRIYFKVPQCLQCFSLENGQKLVNNINRKPKNQKGGLRIY